MKAILALLAAFAISTQATDNYNVVWDSPSKDCHGSMPLGNGDIALNAYIAHKFTGQHWSRD